MWWQENHQLAWVAPLCVWSERGGEDVRIRGSSSPMGLVSFVSTSFDPLGVASRYDCQLKCASIVTVHFLLYSAAAVAVAALCVCDAMRCVAYHLVFKAKTYKQHTTVRRWRRRNFTLAPLYSPWAALFSSHLFFNVMFFRPPQPSLPSPLFFFCKSIALKTNSAGVFIFCLW